MPAATSLQRSPAWWARVLIALSVVVLPRSSRTRYAHEFVADLYGMSRRDQIKYSLGAAMHCVALRNAVSTHNQTAPAEGHDMITSTHRPLHCRLNIRHDWHTEHTEDGARYMRCRRCGKDETGPVQKTTDAQVAAHAAYLLGSGGAGGGGM